MTFERTTKEMIQYFYIKGCVSGKELFELYGYPKNVNDLQIFCQCICGYKIPTKLEILKWFDLDLKSENITNKNFVILCFINRLIDYFFDILRYQQSKFLY